MKNILAENMLRFGVKNLNESKFKRRFLKEQEVTADPTQVKVLSLFSTKSMQIWGTIKPEEKTALLAKAKLQIEKHAKIKGYDYDKSLNNVSNTSVSGKSEITTQPAPPPIVKAPTTYTAYYPDITTPNPELNNFYLTDNETRVSPENAKKFATLITELKAQIPANETIQKIELLGGSATSKVPTTIGNTVPVEQGNIELANRRCAAIVETLENLVKTTFPDYKGEIIKKFVPKPNIGAAYTKTEQTYFFSEFKKLDPAKKAEYDKLYGPYKGSYGSILIETVANEPGRTQTFKPEETIVNNYKITVGFKDMGIPSKPKTRRGSNTGGGISFGGVQVIPVCPFLK